MPTLATIKPSRRWTPGCIGESGGIGREADSGLRRNDKQKNKGKSRCRGKGKGKGLDICAAEACEGIGGV
jgi:hypothetical protein